MLKPSLPIFFLAFLRQLVGVAAPDAVRQMTRLSLAITFAIFVSYGLIVAILRKQILFHPGAKTLLRRAFAIGFAALGPELMLARL